MKIVSINVAPWSSIVGQCISMMDEVGRVIATVNVHPTGGDPKTSARAVASRIAEAFDALAEKEAVVDILGADALDR